MNIDAIRLRYPFRHRNLQRNIQITVYRHHCIPSLLLYTSCIDT